MSLIPSAVLARVARLGTPVLHSPTIPVPAPFFGTQQTDGGPAQNEKANQVVADTYLLHETLRAFQLAHGFGRAMAANQVHSKYSMIAFSLPTRSFSTVKALEALAPKVDEMRDFAKDVDLRFADHLSSSFEDPRVKSVLQSDRCAFTAYNPHVEPSEEDGHMVVWDDCMSIPMMLVRVKRFKSVTLRFTDESGHDVVLRKLPFDLSELVQHEVDHLNGKTALDRMITGDGSVNAVYRDIFFENRDYYNGLVDLHY